MYSSFTTEDYAQNSFYISCFSIAWWLIFIIMATKMTRVQSRMLLFITICNVFGLLPRLTIGISYMITPLYYSHFLMFAIAPAINIMLVFPPTEFLRYTSLISGSTVLLASFGLLRFYSARKMTQ